MATSCPSVSDRAAAGAALATWTDGVPTSMPAWLKRTWAEAGVSAHKAANSGNANASTGEQGYRELAAQTLSSKDRLLKGWDAGGRTYKGNVFDGAASYTAVGGFEGVDAPKHGGVVHPQPARGSGKRTGFRDGEDVAQVVPVDAVHFCTTIRQDYPLRE